MSDYDNYDEYLAFDPNMPRCDIESLQKEIKHLKSKIDFLETSKDFDIGRLEEDCKTLAKKLLEVKPELEGWLKQNFKEYL